MMASAAPASAAKLERKAIDFGERYIAALRAIASGELSTPAGMFRALHARAQKNATKRAERAERTLTALRAGERTWDVVELLEHAARALDLEGR